MHAMERGSTGTRADRQEPGDAGSSREAADDTTEAAVDSRREPPFLVVGPMPQPADPDPMPQSPGCLGVPDRRPRWGSVHPTAARSIWRVLAAVVVLPGVVSPAGLAAASESIDAGQEAALTPNAADPLPDPPLLLRLPPMPAAPPKEMGAAPSHLVMPLLLRLPAMSATPPKEIGASPSRPVLPARSAAVPADLALRIPAPDAQSRQGRGPRPPDAAGGPPEPERPPPIPPAQEPAEFASSGVIGEPPATPDRLASPVPAGPPPAAPAPSALSGQDPVRVVTIPVGLSRRWKLDHQATAVFAAAPEIADVRLLSPDLLYVIGKGIGRTSVAVLDDEGLVEEWLVTTVLDVEPVRSLLTSDPALSQVHVQHFSRGVTLTGEVDSVAAAERAQRLAAAVLPDNAILANEVRVRAPQQVNLEVQIAEVQRSVTESLGISWEAFNRTGLSSELLWKVGRPQFLGPISGFEALAGFPTSFVDGQPTTSVGGRYFGSSGAVQGVIDALATAGLANVLARPNLTAISGETASFFSGGEYPLPVGFRDGVIVFEYKKYGVLLDFVPTVVSPERITLTVRPEVSETSDNEALVTVGTEIPVINVRRAETTVEVGDGESIVIAGLFRTGSNTVESGVPGLKDLPILGVLFRQGRVQAGDTELIVVVTARLVQTGAAPLETAATPHATRQIHGYYY